MQNAFEGQPQGSISSRPTIRRKSSAGLLSSFKAPSSSASLVQTGQQQPSNLPVQLPPTPSASTSPIPGAMAMNRDWDSQSLYSDSAGSSATTASTAVATFQGTSVEYLRDLVQKRIITLTYMRNTHEGLVIYCSLSC
jgi:hypothetical protein